MWDARVTIRLFTCLQSGTCTGVDYCITNNVNCSSLLTAQQVQCIAPGSCFQGWSSRTAGAVTTRIAGICSASSLKPDGTACDDGNPLTTSDTVRLMRAWSGLTVPSARAAPAPASTCVSPTTSRAFPCPTVVVRLCATDGPCQMVPLGYGSCQPGGVCAIGPALAAGTPCTSGSPLLDHKMCDGNGACQACRCSSQPARSRMQGVDLCAGVTCPSNQCQVNGSCAHGTCSWATLVGASCIGNPADNFTACQTDGSCKGPPHAAVFALIRLQA